MTPAEHPESRAAQPCPDEGTIATARDRLRQALGNLQGLPADTIEAIVSVAVIERLDPQETLFPEGAQDDALYFVLEGSLLLSRRAMHDELPLGSVQPGAMVGELSFLDPTTRQATARAGGHPVITARIEPQALDALPDGARHRDALRVAIVVPVVRGFRDQARGLVVATEDRQRFSGFFIYMIAILYGCMLIYFLVAERFVQDTTTNLFAWQSAAVLIVPSIFIVWRLGLSRADLGLAQAEFAPSLRGGLIWGGALATLFVGGFTLARVSGLLPDFQRVQALEMLDLVLYLPHTFVQEFVARGIIQNGYQRFFDDRSGYRSVMFASLVFGVAHIPLGLEAVALTFVGGVLFGLLFLRYRHLVGVTLAHFALGASAIGLGLI